MKTKDQNKVKETNPFVNETTGEILNENGILYVPGHPKQYRFDGQKGKVNINGEEEIGNSITIIPMAWRIFNEKMFGRDKEGVWAEIFFMDDENCVSSIMFNNSSARNFESQIYKAFYKKLSLTDCKITITSDPKSNDKGKYYVALFKIESAPIEKVEALQQFASTNPIYRMDTIIDENLGFCSPTYGANLMQLSA